MALLAADAARAVAVNGEPDRHSGSGPRGLRGEVMSAGAWGWLGAGAAAAATAAAVLEGLMLGPAPAAPLAAHLWISARSARSSGVLEGGAGRCLRARVG